MENEIQNQNIDTNRDLSEISDERLDIVIREEIGRGLLRALSAQFASPHEAVRELVDNALDHPLDQTVEIDVDLGADSLTVRNRGGRGMGPAELGAYLRWGSANEHDDRSLGHYGQGGKSAVLALGAGLRLLTRRSGEATAYAIEDGDLLTGALRSYTLAKIHPWEQEADLKDLSRESGYVRVEVTGLRDGLDMDPDGLRRDLAAVYGRRIAEGACVVRVGGRPVEPLSPALDPEVERAAIDVTLGGVRLTGWAGKLGAGSARAAGTKPGFALFTKRRRIVEGASFGLNLFAKGALAAFYGELEVVGWTPNQNKTGYVEARTREWNLAGGEVLRQAAPILDALRGPGDPTRVTDRDRRLARQIQQELAQVLAEMEAIELGDAEGGSDEILVEVHVQVRKERGPGDGSGGGSGARGGGRAGEDRTELRLATGAGTGERRTERKPRMPDIVVAAWDGPARADSLVLKGRPTIRVNKAHPAYAASNARFAIASAAIAEAVRAVGVEGGVDGYVAEADRVLARWAGGRGGERRGGAGRLVTALLLLIEVSYNLWIVGRFEESRRAALGLLRSRAVVTPADMRSAGADSQVLATLVASGDAERVGRGLYTLAEGELSLHRSLVETTAAQPNAVVCLLSALAFHRLGTQLPHKVWLAIPHGARVSARSPFPTRIVQVREPGFSAGVETHDLEGMEVRVYSKEKTVADLFKFKSAVGLDVALEALREGLETRRLDRSEIFRHARIDRVEKSMRPYLEAYSS